MSGTYVTDLRRFLDGSGEIVRAMPEEARQMASFLALVVDEASLNGLTFPLELSLRCRVEGCTGKIFAANNKSREINWNCSECEQNGVIRNWAGTKWDRSNGE